MTSTASAVKPVLTPRRPLFVAAALGIVYVVWGSTYLAIRIMVEEVPPSTLVGGVIVVLAVTVVVRSESRPQKEGHRA